MTKILAHIDEFGTNSIEVHKEGVSSHFLICATLIKEENLITGQKIIDKVRKTHFQNSEIKSSKVKRAHHARRLTILNDLNEIDFTIYVIVVDKKEIDSEGLSIKQSFYKYFNKQLVTDLNRINNKITFIADQIGTAEYQKSFQKYIEKEVTQYDLFNETKLFEFSDSKENNLIQLSDFIVGSLAKCFDTKHFQENSSDYLKLLKDKLNVRFWPNNVTNYLRTDKDTENLDPKIAELSLNLVKVYIDKNESKVETDITAQIYLLKYLMLIQKISPHYFIQTHELMDKLKNEIGLEYSVRLFRKNIIGNLRDNNVIIVSSNSGGYKLPVNKSDLTEFVNRYNSILQPMLSRMKKCRDSILLGSFNEIDILEYPEYESLKEIIELKK
ncbi:DUF3800 domain-containing protein [Salegentibacter sp. JZCK2]|uniref:DUF3800 domain-containing protein n=1 Tax=Salegentibacter tibetensis TaxID=2873600 RepID=UPI001CCCC05A|nr:DUF3800 domain-containing protein [Salegentibacter tibetensis]MBZ9729989.1 DUF3800 domain-containing protein [Salegentibacter tibetensis]